MKFLTWINLTNYTVTAVAKTLKISHAHIYKYLYEKAIPRQEIMERICDLTMGLVRPNDFYDLTDEKVEQRLLPQLTQRLKKED